MVGHKCSGEVATKLVAKRGRRKEREVLFRRKEERIGAVKRGRRKEREVR